MTRKELFEHLLSLDWIENLVNTLSDEPLEELHSHRVRLSIENECKRILTDELGVDLMHAGHVAYRQSLDFERFLLSNGLNIFDHKVNLQSVDKVANKATYGDDVYGSY